MGWARVTLLLVSRTSIEEEKIMMLLMLMTMTMVLTLVMSVMQTIFMVVIL